VPWAKARERLKNFGLCCAEVPLEAVVEDENPTALREDEEYVLDSFELDEEDGKPQKKGTG
jgi:hypothetical protein